MHRRVTAFATCLGIVALMLPATSTGAQERSTTTIRIRNVGPDYNGGRALPLRQDAFRSSAVAATSNRVGTVREWLAIDDIQGFIYKKKYKLRAKGKHIEVWVATGRSPVCDGNSSTPCPVDEDTVIKGLQFLPGDCRNDERIRVTDRQVRYLKNQFDKNMYPKESRAFSKPLERDGRFAELYSSNAGRFRQPRGYYKGDGDNIVVFVDNVRDDSFYDLSNAQQLPYIAGFFFSTFNDFFDRNIMTIDAYDWIHRTGANPPDEPVPGDACASKPARPFLYESTFAHEYQHLLEHYEDPDEVNWVNEGLSDWAQSRTGYAVPSKPITDTGFDSHIQCFLGWLEVQTPANPNPRPGGPENSLTSWDEPEILCDYGAAYTIMEFLRSRYGRGFMRQLHRYDGNGLGGLNELLEDVDQPISARQLLHEWNAAMALDGVLDDGAQLTGASADTYQVGGMHAFINWDNDDAYSEQGAPPNGADYVRLRDASGGYLDASELTSLSFDGGSNLDPMSVEWTVDDTPPPTHDGQTLHSGSGSDFDRSIAQSVNVPQNDPTLRFDTFFATEEGYDYGFVQISTDGGETWRSLSNSDTTTESASDAATLVRQNLPGFTGHSGCELGEATTGSCQPSWVPQSFDLSAFAGDDILVGFRYVTDGAVDGDGWWIDDIEVGNKKLSQGTTVNDWQTYNELDPDTVEGFTLQLIAYNDEHTQAGYANVPLGAGFTADLNEAALDALLPDDADVIAALVSYDESTELIPQYAPYTLRANGALQPGGS